MNFNNEELRVLANTEAAYMAWLDAERQSRKFSDRVVWKTVAGKQYLYRLTDRNGNGSSYGPRSAETELIHANYAASKSEAIEALAGARERLAETWPVYRALNLPTIDRNAANVFREADVLGMMGTSLLVVGTNTLPIYEIEAVSRFAIGMDSTNDCDMAWSAAHMTLSGNVASEQPILSMLKAIDQTYTVNTEKPFQARNSKAYEVEILLAPSMEQQYPKKERIRPIPMPEQEWLLKGKSVTHVLYSRDGHACRMSVPDPRWMALHKLWLADKPQRSRLKAPKDRAQGNALLKAVKQHMPHYRLDAAFERELPADLEKYLQASMAASP